MLKYTQYLMVEKHQVSAFQNFLWIENQLNIKKVMNRNVCVCSFPIFDIHSITALTLFDLSLTSLNIDSITFKENENDIFDMSHTLYSAGITM